MSKHIIDGPRKRDDSERLQHFAKIDKDASGKRSQQSESLDREPRTRNTSETLRRYVDIDRQG